MKKLVLLLLFPLVFSLAACQDKKEEKKEVVKPVKTMVIGGPRRTIERSFPGKVLATKEAKVSFKVPGELIELSVLEGQDLKKGEVIAKLDPRDYQDQVNETEARHLRAETQHKRMAILVKEGHVSHADYEKERANFLVRKANMDTAKRNLGYTVLRAPFEGLITRKYVEKHELVKKNQPIINLQDVTEVDIESDLPEKFILHMPNIEKDKVWVTFPSVKDRKFSVKFKELSSEADPETQTYRAVVTMPAPKGLSVLPGMTAIVNVRVGPAKGSGPQQYFEVPSSAVFDNKEGKASVWLVNEKTSMVKSVPVKVTRLTGDKIRLLSGVKKGDRIVISGATFLQEGQKIKALPETEIGVNP